MGNPTTRGRPRVKTARGIRYGARATISKTRGGKIYRRAFWGRGQVGNEVEAGGTASGAMQIFQRITDSKDSKLRKLTGPGVAQMVRGSKVLGDVNTIMQGESERLLKSNLDFYLAKKAGIL